MERCLHCLDQAGGRNSVLQRPLVPGGLENTTIIFGADVTHPASGEDSSASIAAVSFSHFLTSNCLLHR